MLRKRNKFTLMATVAKTQRKFYVTQKNLTQKYVKNKFLELFFQSTVTFNLNFF